MVEAPHCSSTDSNCGYSPPKFDLKFLMLLTAVAAIWLALWPVTTMASKVLLAIYGLTYLFGCWKTRRAVLAITPALYLPYVWLFWDWASASWSGYRWQWIGMLWQLPGLLAEVAFHPASDFWFGVITSTATIAIYFSAIMLARVNVWMTVVTAVVLFAVSIVNSCICLMIFRV